MAAAASGAPPRSERDQREESGIRRTAQQAEKRAKPLLAFWTKVTNDWVFDFSGELAYTFLVSIFPILIAIIGIAGLVVGAIAPGAKEELVNNIGSALPGATGREIVRTVLTRLSQNAGIIFVIGLLTAIFSGSRLFVTLEKQFGVIFRLKGRDPLHQNLMAVGMMLLYIVLVPLVIFGSTIPSAVLSAMGINDSNPVLALLINILGVVVGVLAAMMLFGTIYFIVPNRPVKLGEIWRGTLVAAALLTIYELLFPIYQSTLLKPNSYGAIAGFAIVILAFFYYLGFILLFGAEVNSWFAGQRQTAGPLDTILHEVQAHDTTRGAAGPTAGDPQEDLQDHKGAAEMTTAQSAIRHERGDHRGDVEPPKYAESGTTGSGYRQEGDSAIDRAKQQGAVGSERSGTQADGRSHASRGVQRSEAGESAATTGATHVGEAGDRRSDARLQPLTSRQKRALAATLAAGAVAVAPAVRFLGRLITGDEEPRHPATD